MADCHFVFHSSVAPQDVMDSSFTAETLRRVLEVKYQMAPDEAFAEGVSSPLLKLLLPMLSVVVIDGTTETKYRGAVTNLWARLNGNGLQCWKPSAMESDVLDARLRHAASAAPPSTTPSEAELAGNLKENLEARGGIWLESVFDNVERAADNTHATQNGVHTLIANLKRDLNLTPDTLLVTDSSLVPHSSEHTWDEKSQRWRCWPVSENWRHCDEEAANSAAAALNCIVRVFSGSGLLTRDGGYARRLLFDEHLRSASRIILFSAGNDLHGGKDGFCARVLMGLDHVRTMHDNVTLAYSFDVT
jgi:hypothetical protein